MKSVPKLICLVLAMALALCGLPAMAEENEPAEHVQGAYTYILLEDGTAEIVGYSWTGSETGIPEELDGHIVSSIAGNPFVENDELERFDVSPDHPYFAVIDGVLFFKPEKRLVAFPHNSKATEYAVPQGIRAIGDEAFKKCRTLTRVTLPDTVESIGAEAFYDCKKLQSIVIPDGVTVIGDKTFRNCMALREAVIPDGVTHIGAEAFGNCNALASIALPDSVISLGENPFLTCDKLTEIMVSPEHPCLETIDGVLFMNEGQEKRLVTYPIALTAAEYTVPEGVTCIGDSAFWFCETIHSVVLPEGVTAIGEYAFARCKYLESIVLPETLRTLESYAFSNCQDLQSAVIPDGVNVIAEGLFDGCSDLASITLPASVAAIERKAFSGCPGSLVMTVDRDSCAQAYAKENDISYTYPDTNDWLNDW